MATKGLISNIRNIYTRSSHLYSTTTTVRGRWNHCDGRVSVGANKPLQYAPAMLPHVNQSSLCQQTKALELHLAAGLSARLAAPLPHAPSQSPGFRKTNLIIGYIQVNISAILDPAPSATLIGDLVPDRPSDVVGDNPEATNKQPAYKARHIQKIRRWKMNRHRLLKLRKRMKTFLERQVFQKTKRKVARSDAIVKAIIQDGEQFDALEFVTERLARAKKGGFEHDIWKPADEQPPVPWTDYEFSRRRIKTYETKVKPPKIKTKKEKKAIRQANKRLKQMQ